MNPDFLDILSALSAEGAEFLLVGAYALAVHGYPRATGDLDIWVRPSPENAGRVWKALVRFGAPLLDLNEHDLARPDTVFQIGVAPGRIDILCGIDGVRFGEAWDDHVVRRIGGIDIPVISRAALIRNKKAAGRPKDLADVHALEDGSEDPADPR